MPTSFAHRVGSYNGWALPVIRCYAAGAHSVSEPTAAPSLIARRVGSYNSWGSPGDPLLCCRSSLCERTGRGTELIPDRAKLHSRARTPWPKVTAYALGGARLPTRST